jgi:serine/threonine protein kinase
MPLSPGAKLGPYEIVSPIGKGGMGEVWKGRDTRLNRDVAIKFSSNQFSGRFEREAKAIAALNHPNICQIYDVGPDYLVMEYIDGAPPRGPLAPPEAVRLALGIAAALEAAHGKGITHRDLKPANILVTQSGIKLLDFGLALVNDNSAVGIADAPTALSVAGAVMGTVAYMSPEQAQGKPADARSDIFSLVWCSTKCWAAVRHSRVVPASKPWPRLFAKSRPRWMLPQASPQSSLAACASHRPAASRR